MKLFKMLSKLRSVTNAFFTQDEAMGVSKEEPHARPQDVNGTALPEALAKAKYSGSLIKLIQNHGNDVDAQPVILERLSEMNNNSLEYVLESLLNTDDNNDCIQIILDGYIDSVEPDDKVWTLIDFGFHWGNKTAVINLIDGCLPAMKKGDVSLILTDLALNHGSSEKVQDLLMKYLHSMNDECKYDVIQGLASGHGTDEKAKKTILKISDSLPSHSRDRILDYIRNNLKVVKVDKKDETLEVDKLGYKSPLSLPKIKVMICDLGEIGLGEPIKGEQSSFTQPLKVNFNNPVKVFPYTLEKDADSQIGDAFLVVEDNKVFATVTLSPQLGYMAKTESEKPPVYKASGVLSLRDGKVEELSVNFVYVVFQ